MSIPQNSPQSNVNDEYWMRKALQLAQHAESLGEVPVGAVLIKDNQLVADGWNRPISSHDPTAHAEIVVLRKAGHELQNYRIVDTVLYVTLEPCVMCAGALIHARVKRVVYGASDPKAGAGESVFNILQDDRFNHRIEVTSGVLAQECSQLLSQFFQARRKK
ncbi:MAG: tRNA adenosine(34) deaminase TadA [Gammaproteobacteria bacterium]|jgi:tRNA(adenine34) deaminase|nr:tRNA adenosine(34) deaminase TadA [Gammaproteobacteria bacterium]